MSNERSFATEHGLEVYVAKSGNIIIKSFEDAGGPGELMIPIPVDRVDQVIEWLRECKKEALASSG